MRKILIVDDEPLMHILYKRHLELEGFELLGARDGSEALQVVAEIRPDLILMDIMMPGLDGLSVICELRQNEAIKNVPVIVITANVSQYETMRKHAKIRGAEGLLTKPLSPAKLVEEVRRVLQSNQPPQVCAAA